MYVIVSCVTGYLCFLVHCDSLICSFFCKAANPLCSAGHGTLLPFLIAIFYAWCQCFRPLYCIHSQIMTVHWFYTRITLSVNSIGYIHYIQVNYSIGCLQTEPLATCGMHTVFIFRLLQAGLVNSYNTPTYTLALRVEAVTGWVRTYQLRYITAVCVVPNY